MTQLELDLGDEEPTVERVLLTAVGTTSRDLSLDPREFAGMTVPTITEEIKKILAGIAPGVDFFEPDLVEAANELHAAQS